MRDPIFYSFNCPLHLELYIVKKAFIDKSTKTPNWTKTMCSCALGCSLSFPGGCLFSFLGLFSFSLYFL